MELSNFYIDAFYIHASYGLAYGSNYTQLYAML